VTLPFIPFSLDGIEHAQIKVRGKVVRRNLQNVIKARAGAGVVFLLRPDRTQQFFSARIVWFDLQRFLEALNRRFQSPHLVIAKREIEMRDGVPLRPLHHFLKLADGLGVPAHALQVQSQACPQFGDVRQLLNQLLKKSIGLL